LPERHAKKIVKGILDALTHVHRLGILHRNVKPENVLLTKEGTARLADFGIACRLVDADSQQVRGSPGYVAPEILVGMRCSAAMDIFSTGVLLYFTLSAQTPFKGTTQAETYAKTVEGKVDFTATPISHVTEECKSCILQLLQNNPEKRPAALQALHDVWFGRGEFRMKMACAKDSFGCNAILEDSPPPRVQQAWTDVEPLSPSGRSTASGTINASLQGKLKQTLPELQRSHTQGASRLGTPVSADVQDRRQARRVTICSPLSTVLWQPSKSNMIKLATPARSVDPKCVTPLPQADPPRSGESFRTRRRRASTPR